MSNKTKPKPAISKVKSIKGQYILMREHVLEIDRLKAALAKQCPNCGHPRPEPGSAAAWQIEGYIKALEREVKRLRRKVKQ